MNRHFAKRMIFFFIAMINTIGSSGWAASVEYVEVKTIPLYEVFKTKEQWHATVYQARDIDKWSELYDSGKIKDAIDRPAKLCFWYNPDKKNHLCFSAVNTAPGEPKFTFQHFKELKIVRLQKGREPEFGVLLIAKNEGYNLGEYYRGLYFATIWALGNRDKEFVNILPTLNFTDQGEFRVVPQMTGMIGGVAVKADFVWSEGEARYSPHRYQMSIFQLAADDRYQFIGNYETRRKYKSLDDADEIDVVRHELSNILKFIEHAEY